MSGAGEYPVWDLPVRVTHWSLVVLVALQYASGEYELFDLEWHLVLGQVTLMFVLFRVLWGLFCSDNARFGHFLRGPRAVLRHAKGLFKRTPAARAGHNPLGGWSALLLLVLLSVQCATGLFASDDVATAGPLADAVSDRTVRLLTRWHKYGEKALLVLIGLHLAGVAWHALYKREALVRPMLKGRRALPGDPGLRFAGAGRAVLLAAISVAAVWWVTTL